MSASTPRVVLISGASSGIGEATVHAAARRGDHVVLLARGPQNLARVAADAVQLGAASSHAVSVDVGDAEAVESVVGDVLAEHGRLDLVVANAGVVAYGRFEEVPAEVFEKVIRTNILGTANLARAVLPTLRKQDAGSLVLVGSVIGHLAVPEMAAYVVSKWGVRALARQLQVENVDRRGVHVGYVAPGGVDTPIYRQAGTYSGVIGRPPFPVAAPARVAARILAVAERPSRRSQVGWANDLMRVGFTALPRVYDGLVTPLFKVAAQDLTTRSGPGPGNVLSAHESGNGPRGEQGSALVGIARNLATLVRQR